VVFGGFSAEALRDRINDQHASVLVTADGGYRRGHVVPLKQTVDTALEDAPSIEHVVVFQRRPDQPFAVNMKAGRDKWYHELMNDASAVSAPEPMDAEDMLYILYTSGTTGKPKGVQRDTGGYAVALASSMRRIYCVGPGDTMFTTSDIGWVVGHSYIVYGPLIAGGTTITARTAHLRFRETVLKQSRTTALLTQARGEES
jgi:acetyl-CoA synthetase